MKNLANCKPSEFLKQTNKIKKSVEKWLTATEIMEIRKRLPVYPDGVDEEKKKAIIQKQANENLSAMFDAIFDSHPDETLELLALLCFVEPENVDDYPIKDYLSSIAEMLEDAEVVSFFTSFMQLVRKLTSN